MSKFTVSYIALLLTLLLSSCDIEPVSTGAWEIEVELSSGIEEFVWTVSAEGSVAMTGENIQTTGEAILEGSRISWSGESVNPQDPSRTINANFNGTVDGDRLQGTLFTTLGNMSVSGKRQ